MKNKFRNFILVSSFALLLGACADAPKSEMEANAKPEVALPQSGKADNNVFYATGEVVVFFEPSLERAKQLEEEGGREFEMQKRAFQKANAEYMEKLEAMGIVAYKSREKNIKINVSETQFYVVQTSGVKEGYGVAMAKLNAQPKILKGIPTWEELEKEVKAYYGK
jgi:hypothetical protein